MAKNRKQDVLTDTQKAIITSMANCGLTMNKAAKLMHYGRSTVFYHVEAIRKKTNLDPRNFYGMVKLLEMAKEEV